MKSKTHKILISILSIILSVVMFSAPTLNAFAAGRAAETTYIKDVKLIFAKDMAEAKTLVPRDYNLIEYDLNKGTEYVFDVYEVYLAYTTTTNPDEAITDIKMMNMNGGFVYSDYEEQMKNVHNDVKEIAMELKAAVAVFRVNYFNGTYGAKAAYRALNAFTVDEAGGMGLADYFLYGKPTDEFFIKLVLNVHCDILASILSALTIAVQGAEGNTWLDRLSRIYDPERVAVQPDYWDKAYILWDHFYNFYETYDSIDHDLYRNGNGQILLEGTNDGDSAIDVSDSASDASVANTGSEILYEVAYLALEQYSFGNGTTFSEWFVNPDIYEEMLYCLLEVMTPAEYAMMRLCGPLYMILATSMDGEVYNDYISKINEITGGKKVCSIWAGVNSELFRSSIGVTDAAIRAIAETEFEQELNNEGDSSMDATLKTAGLIAAAGAIPLGIGIIGGGLFAGSIGAVLTGGVVSSASVVLGITSVFLAALGAAAIVVAAVIAIVYFGVWLAEWWQEHHPEYTEIPEYMYDYVKDGSGNAQFLLYEVVRFQDGKAADVNAWEGKEWHAMYVSRDKAAGAPIEADIIVRYADGRIDDGFAGLATFGRVNAENLNLYADADDVKGIYVTYRQKDISGDYARGKYLSDLKLFSDTDPERCRVALENERYVLYNVNLTPNSKYFTYLGYKTTSRATHALTDIRLAYGYNSAQYAAGGGSATYAASGSTGDGKITLYVTTISQFGSPILSDFLVLNSRSAPAGYEPANLFSGGPAVSFNLKDGKYLESSDSFYLYFLPSVTYTSGPEYIGGIATIFDVPLGYLINGLSTVNLARAKLGFKTLKSLTGTEGLEGALVYTTTYNPYRAIYGITAVSSGGELGKSFAETITYDGIGYSLATRYLVTVNNDIEFERNNRSNDSRLYVASAYSGGVPMLVSDIYATSEQNDSPAGFTPVIGRMSDNAQAANLSAAFNFTAVNVQAGVAKKLTIPSLYLFVRGSAYIEGNYLTSLYLSSKEQVLGGIDLDCDDLDNSYVMNSLAAQGAHSVIHKNLNLEDSDNATYLGYTKLFSTDPTLAPITDLLLYYAGKTNASPEYKIVYNGITYHLVNDINLFCEEDGERDVCDRVYLYYTTNPAAGSPIVDIKIDNNAILNGWSTVRTQHGKALSADMDDFWGDMWFIHLKRANAEPKYISEIVIGWGSDAEAKAMLVEAGCDYMLAKDLNDNCGLLTDYVYIGYKKTNNASDAIRDLRTTHDDDVKSFEKNGVTYFKINGNLNSYTNVFADDIFLYFTKDAKAGTPLTSLETSADPVDTTRSGKYIVSTVLNQKDKASDLNDGAGGDYIYLLQIRDKDDQGALASMIGEGSLVIVIVFVIVSVCAIVGVYMTQKKRHVNTTKDAAKKSDTDDAV